MGDQVTQTSPHHHKLFYSRWGPLGAHVTQFFPYDQTLVFPSVGQWVHKRVNLMNTKMHNPSFGHKFIISKKKEKKKKKNITFYTKH
jgi:hypothetical protein